MNLDDIINKISLSKDRQVGLFIGLLLVIIISNINDKIMNTILDIYPYVYITAVLLFGSIIGKPIYDFINNYYIGFIRKKNTENFLKHLTNDEKDILKVYMNENIRTQYISISNGVINGLSTKGLVYCSSNIGIPGGTSIAFNIQDMAFKILQKNPEFLM